MARGLTGLPDPERQGAVAIRRVQPREERLSRALSRTKPPTSWSISPRDIASPGRPRWGASPQGHFEDNVKKWSGDHIIDPDQVPGVLFMNRPFRASGARLLDLAPTILAALGVPKGPAMEGESLLP